jgi:hypothetical protein
MDAQRFPGFQLLLGKQALLAVNMGGLAFFNDHGITPPGKILV